MLALTLAVALATGIAHHARRRLSASYQSAGSTLARQRSLQKAHDEAAPLAPVAANPEIPLPTHGYLPDPGHPPARVPGHLFLDTSPTGAEVWIDGIWRGRTPVDLATGPGGHRMVAVKSGFLSWRAVYDTTQGTFARTELQSASPPRTGDAFLDVECRGANHLPVVLDDDETGFLCPASRVPVTSGRHSVGILVPSRRAKVTVEIDVPAGPQPRRVVLDDGPGAR
jgi:hypothetical protein